MASAASLARRRVCALVLSRAHAGSGVCGSHVARPLIVDPNVYVSRSEISTSTSVCVSSSGSRSGSSRRAATEDTPGVLLRDFLTSALYDNTHGYFSQPDVPVGSFPTPIAFRTLLGADDYNRVLADKYSKLTKQWLTPVEIFKPHYSQAVARYVLDVYTTHDLPNGYPLLVYELGGGAGTHAVGFLELIRKQAPEVFRHMRYVSVEISGSLAAVQRKEVGEAFAGWQGERVSGTQSSEARGVGQSNPESPSVGTSNPEKSPYAVQTRDAADRFGWGETQKQPCFVIALEVLDNLPHDKVVSVDNCWMETRIVAITNNTTDTKDNSEYAEVLTPVSDLLIERTLRAVERASAQKSLFSKFVNFVSGADQKVRYLPTGSAKLLETLHNALPNHRLIAADFDSLPGVRMPGVSAPLVATQTGGGQTSDLQSYLEKVGQADVFFPTDFETLRVLDAAAAKKSPDQDRTGEFKPKSQVTTTRAFMEKWARVDATATGSGYNPLLQDFSNTKFFLS